MHDFIGPISGPQEAEFILKNTKRVHGFYGASSMERLPVEQAITNTVRVQKNFLKMRIIVDRCDLQPAVLSIHFADFYDVWLAMLDYLEARLFINHVHFLTNVPCWNIIMEE